jgi:microcystin-dependent protein
MSTTTGKPFSNLQPSLAVTVFTPFSGIYPSSGGSGSAIGDTLGFVYAFAGNYAPGNSLLLQGQTLPIASYAAQFSILGTSFGGNGVSTFALPDLANTAIVGTGTGPRLSPEVLGQTSGSATVSLSLAQSPAGGDQPFANTQPSLALTPMICVSGEFPSESAPAGSATFIGQVAYFEGSVTPAGWLPCDGRLLSTSSNTALFSILGTTYGGDGKTDFALPDLRGRVAVGADTDHPLGTTWGEASTTLTQANLPAPTGTDAPVNNDQPSIALNYLVLLSGVFSTNGSGAGLDQNSPIVGQIVAFAGNFAPGGYALCNGSLIPIATDPALFSILGTQYGGNGTTNFALPDLRGRTLVGAGGGTTVGTVKGSHTIMLSAANLPSAPCFAAGTCIATARGQVPVETLRVGDRVLTSDGTMRPVVWLGWREVACDRHPRPEDVSIGMSSLTRMTCCSPRACRARAISTPATARPLPMAVAQRWNCIPNLRGRCGPRSPVRRCSRMGRRCGASARG